MLAVNRILDTLRIGCISFPSGLLCLVTNTSQYTAIYGNRGQLNDMKKQSNLAVKHHHSNIFAHAKQMNEWKAMGNGDWGNISCSAKHTIDQFDGQYGNNANG